MCVMKTEIASGYVRFSSGIIRWGVVLCLLLALFMMAGCAATSNAVTDEEIVTNQKPMSTYTSLLLRDFELKHELFTDADGRMSEREKRYALVPEQLTERVLGYVKSRRVYQNVSRNEKLSDKTLVMQGKFVRMGRFRISLEAVLLDGGTGKEVAYVRQTLWDVLDTTEAVDRLGRELADFLDRIQYK